MSRIMIVEIPDKYQLSSRDFINEIKEKYSDANLLASKNFQWWKDYCKTKDINECVSPITKINDDIVKLLQNPLSYEEKINNPYYTINIQELLLSDKINIDENNDYLNEDGN